MSRTQFGTQSQKKIYRCKDCSATDTVYHPVASELKCKACGSIARVTSKDLEKLKIIQTGRKKEITKGMSKLDRMKKMIHKRDKFQDNLSVCGIEQSGKFSDITLTDSSAKVTCEKCEWNS